MTNAEVSVHVFPREAERFTSPALSLGGRHDWRYDFRFRGLNLVSSQ